MCVQVVARSGVSARHSFVKALLHVWCETERTAMLMQREYAGGGGGSFGEPVFVLMLISAYNVFAFIIFLFSALLPIAAFLPFCL